jgi:hypothetical protein
MFGLGPQLAADLNVVLALIRSGIGIEELLCRRWSPIAVPRLE